jgi:hypothetical protein
MIRADSLRQLRAVTLVLGLSALMAGCAGNGNTHVGVSYGFGYHWYDDPWYRDDIYVRPPVNRPRPEHPIARPPVRPMPLPARPMPRPMPRPALR